MEISCLSWLILLGNICVLCALEPLTTASVSMAAMAAVGYFGFSDTVNRMMEFCNHHASHDDRNISSLQNELQRSVYGQHLMQDIVVRALRGHMISKDPSKALVLSFHGSPGCGKSYVSEFIAQSLYKYGMKSKFVRKFVGGADFPERSQTETYKRKVRDEIKRIVGYCERALFIFEDADKMPTGVLDAVVPFIDHHTIVDGLDFRKSTFIFLSNTGASLIVQKTLELWMAGKQREEIKLHDFEEMIRRGSFNEEGGLRKSDTISASLIDFYIPFLPLQEEHVRECIKDAFRKLGIVDVNPSELEEILVEMTFMPPEVELFSTTGCKRIAAKVAAYYDGITVIPL